MWVAIELSGGVEYQALPRPKPAGIQVLDSMSNVTDTDGRVELPVVLERYDGRLLSSKSLSRASPTLRAQAYTRSEELCLGRLLK